MRIRQSTHRRDDVEMLSGKERRRYRGSRVKVRPWRKCPKTKPRWIASSVIPFTNTTPIRKLNPSGPQLHTDTVDPGIQREKSPHRQADQQRDDNRRHSCPHKPQRAQRLSDRLAEDQPLRDENRPDAPQKQQDLLEGIGQSGRHPEGSCDERDDYDDCRTDTFAIDTMRLKTSRAATSPRTC